jgi:hypothetical protein
MRVNHPLAMQIPPREATHRIEIIRFPRIGGFMPASRFQRYARLATTLTIALLACTVQAEPTNPRGQWVGNTQVEGQRDVDKTALQLGTADEANTKLQIDTGRTCMLREGTYTAQGDDAWSLRFKSVNGESACDRLSQGEFTLRVAGPRKLAIEIRYPDRKGGQNLRNGVLARYP